MRHYKCLASNNRPRAQARQEGSARPYTARRRAASAGTLLAPQPTTEGPVLHATVWSVAYGMSDVDVLERISFLSGLWK